MCGITGVCGTDVHKPIARELVVRMSNTLRHRGPDGDGVYVAPGIGLGHRRLSIIDVEGGDQPIWNEDKSVVIVFNGEIYNFKELRKELISRGHKFSTKSDTEVIVHLYEDEGFACLDKLNGMFAFALWDEKRKLLFAARDRMGEKPLFYTVQNGELIFSSEMKGVLAHPAVTASLSTQGLDEYLAYGYIPSPNSIYKEIKKLEPGSYFIWKQGKLTIERYWSPKRVGQEIPYSQESVEHLRALLEDSVSKRLRSDVPVGAFLSGGMDSSLIVALSRIVSTDDLQTFTVKFAGTGLDESEYARAVAEKYGTIHREIVVEDFGLDVLPRLVSQFDEPFADPSSVPTYYVTREASKFVKVCLSGDAGDELFGGYTRYLDEPMEHVSNMMPTWIRHRVFKSLSGVMPAHVKGSGWVGRMALEGAGRYQAKNGIFSPQERSTIFKREFRDLVDAECGYFSRVLSESTQSDLKSQYMELDQKTYLPEDILVKVDRTSMLNSLEVRVPLLDHKIVEYANRLALDAKIRGKVQKRILKKILADLVPSCVIDRPKQGFGLPLAQWFRSRFRDEMESILLDPGVRLGEFMERDEIRKLVEGHQKGQRDFGARIWSLIWLETWLRDKQDGFV